MGAPTNAQWLAPLDRHRERRLQGVPTLSVLVGASDAGEWVWASLHRRDARKFTVAIGPDRHSLFDQWLCTDGMRVAIRTAMLETLAARGSLPVVELQAHLSALGPAQLAAFVDRETSALGCWVGLIRAAVGEQPISGRDIHEAFPEALQSLSHSVELPSLLLSPNEDDDIVALARHGIAIAEAIPRLDVGLTISEAQLDRVKRALRQGTLATFLEGVLHLRPHPDRPRANTIQQPLVEYDPVELARSSAERELRRHLERRPKTRGLFALNGCIAARGEGGDVEIDFLCERLKLAVEVDGYHHFRDATAYRRDRRKDAELQLRGYVVVRVLAEDVTEHLEHVLETIDGVVDELQNREERP